MLSFSTQKSNGQRRLIRWEVRCLQSSIISRIYNVLSGMSRCKGQNNHLCTSVSSLRMVLLSSDVFLSLVSLSTSSSSSCLSANHSFSDRLWAYCVCLSRLSWTHTHTHQHQKLPFPQVMKLHFSSPQMSVPMRGHLRNFEASNLLEWFSLSLD